MIQEGFVCEGLFLQLVKATEKNLFQIFSVYHALINYSSSHLYSWVGSNQDEVILVHFPNILPQGRLFLRYMSFVYL